MKKKKYIDFESKGLDDGFVPQENYMHELERSIFEKLRIEEKLDSIEDGFNVEDDYFSALEHKIIDATINQQENDINGRVISLLGKKSYWMAAASIAAIFLAVLIIPSNDNLTELSFSDLTPEAEEWYVKTNELFLTDDDLSMLLDKTVYNVQIEDDAVNNELESYLLNNELHFIEY